MIKKIFLITLELALIFGFAYSLCQQVLRQSANDPQIQIAEDAVAALARGQQPKFFTSDVYGTVDPSKSLAPFLIAFDNAGKPLTSTAVLNGKTPIPPAGVLAYAKAHQEDRITWQPAPDVRIAAVVVYYGEGGGGYVLAGRSLAEVEKRESNLEFLTFCAWIFSVFVSAVIIFISEKIILQKLK